MVAGILVRVRPASLLNSTVLLQGHHQEVLWTLPAVQCHHPRPIEQQRRPAADDVAARMI
jgi:hypothetical protein